jgi:hypothetical protein
MRRKPMPWTGPLLLALAVTPAAAQVTIDNDLAAGTLGYLEAHLQGANETLDDQAARLVVTANSVIVGLVTSDVMFDYRPLVDPGIDGSAIYLGSTVTAAAALTGDDEVSSAGSFAGANGNTIAWTAVTALAAGDDRLVTTYTFTAQTGTLGALRVYSYLDSDVAELVGDEVDDAIQATGSAGAGDLLARTFDVNHVYGISHGGAYSGAQGLVSASFAGWAADKWPDLQTAVESAAVPPVSPAGTIDTVDLPAFIHGQAGGAYGPEDTTSLFAWDVVPSATTATVVTSLEGLIEPPNVSQTFYTVAPCRVVDTRLAGQAPALANGVERTFTLHGACGIPATAESVALNVTITGPTGSGHVTLYPGDTAVPATSTLNFRPGQTRANNAIVPLSVDDQGVLAARASVPPGGSVHLIVDVTGYFE